MLVNDKCNIDALPYSLFTCVFNSADSQGGQLFSQFCFGRNLAFLRLFQLFAFIPLVWQPGCYFQHHSRAKEVSTDL